MSFTPTQQQLRDSGAFDPIVWRALIKRVDCPTDGQWSTERFPCKYFRSPQPGDSPEPPVTWDCPAGSFCLSPAQLDPCPPGFYCPVNSAQALICPEGFACSNDTTTIIPCPASKFCPLGTVTPKSCGGLSSCPEGSSKAPKFLVLLVFLLISGGIYMLYRWKQSVEKIRDVKRKQQLEEVGAKSKFSDKPAIKPLEKTFNIEFDNLGLKLENGIEIMKGVTGALYSGRTCAVMGPSGAGKTTFVTLLTGKVERTSGTVKLNGKPDELSKYSKLIGYVPQEDIMIRELTVRDILMHSARMRLPAHWEYSAVKTKVYEIISFLGMSHISTSIIGNEEERGVSGGQRKRVNIGMELAAEPSVLFLDEPTSGLDSSTSFEVCQNLRQIAIQQGLTVAAVIHSPSPATFRQFDDFLLLGKGGRVVYMGPRDGALGYFAQIGFTCPADESPSDYFMDVASGLVASEFDPAFKPTDLFTYWEQRNNLGAIFEAKRRMEVEEAVQARKEYHRVAAPPVPERKPLLSLPEDNGAAFVDMLMKGLRELLMDFWAFFKDVALEFFTFLWALFRMVTMQSDPVRDVAPMYMQGWFLMKRAFQQVYRDVNATLTDLAMNFAAGVFISVAIQGFSFVGGSPEKQCIYAPVNIFFLCLLPLDTMREAGMFICLGSMFACIAISGNTFGREKVVYWRDTASGMSVLPYYLAKLIVDIPRIFLGAISYSIALIIFFPYQQPFANLFSVVLMLHFYSFAVGYALSTAVKYSSLAISGTGISLLWCLVLSGVNPQLSDIETFPSWINWLWRVSVPRYMVESFYIKEIQALPFQEKNQPSPPHSYNWDSYQDNFITSIEITIAWHVLAVLGLKLFNRIKQK